VRALAVRASARFESVEALQNAWKEAAVIEPQPEYSGVSSSNTSPDTDQLSLEKSTELEQRDGVYDGDSQPNAPRMARSKPMPVWMALASLGLFGSITFAAWLLNVPDSFEAPHSTAEINRPSQEMGQSGEKLADDHAEYIKREEPQSQLNEPAEIDRPQDLNAQAESIYQAQIPEEPEPQNKPLQFDNNSPECRGRGSSLEFVTCSDASGSAIDLLKRMIVISSDNGGVGHENELDRIIRQIEVLPKPTIVDRNISRSENEKGLTVFREERFDEAKQHFLLAYQKNPSDPEVADNLSYTYLRLGDLQSAVDMIAKALALSPSRATAWNQLANYYAQKRQFVESVACFALTFRYSRKRDRTHQVLQQLASENPNPNVRYSANKALNLDFIKNNITIGGIVDAIPRSAPEDQMTTPVDTSRSISERGRELAGLRQGMSYSQAREIVLDAGWQGKNKRWQDISQYGQEKEVYYKNNWREVASCAGTGTSPCRFEFHDIHSHLLVIITEGECLNAQFEVPKEGETCDLTVSSWFID
jgi:tetratricopeptide (TPR) repeat protein